MAVNRKLVNPNTGRRMQRVYVEGTGWYTWNRVYHVYNAVADYRQLQPEDLVNVLFDHEETNEEVGGKTRISIYGKITLGQYQSLSAIARQDHVTLPDVIGRIITQYLKTETETETETKET